MYGVSLVRVLYEPPHDKTNKWHVRPAKTDQPGHPVYSVGS